MSCGSALMLLEHQGDSETDNDNELINPLNHFNAYVGKILVKGLTHCSETF